MSTSKSYSKNIGGEELSVLRFTRFRLAATVMSLFLGCLGFAQSISIAGALPDPAGGTTYCFAPEGVPQTGYTGFGKLHFKFNVTSTGGNLYTYVSVAVRFYAENYNSSMTYEDYACSPFGDGLSWGTPVNSGSLSVDEEHFEDPSGADQNVTPYYLIFGVQLTANLVDSRSNQVLASSVWHSWDGNWNSGTGNTGGGIKLDYGSHSGVALISGWFGWHNSSPNYGPPNHWG